MNRVSGHSNPAAQDNAGGRSRRLELYTLGGIRLYGGGVDYSGQIGARHQALLAYLVFEGRPVDPGDILEVLGRGGSQEDELAALERAIIWLNQQVPGLSIEMSRDSVALGEEVSWDVRELDEALDRGDVVTVAKLYTGDFLAGFQSGRPAFDAWAKEQRRNLREFWDGALKAAALESEKAGRWSVAARWWQVLVARNPTRADAVAKLMGAYGRSKDRESAERAYAVYLRQLAARGAGKPGRAVQEMAARLSISEPLLDAQPTGATSQPATAPEPHEPSDEPAPVHRSEPVLADTFDYDLEPPVDRRTVPPVDRGAAPTNGQRGAPRTVPAAVSFGPPPSRAATAPAAFEDYEEDEDGVLVFRSRPKRRRAENAKSSDVFTDSFVVYLAKTIWATLTTPRALMAYRQFMEEMAAAAVATARALALMALAAAKWSWAWSLRGARAALVAAMGLGRTTRRGLGHAGGVARQGTGVVRQLGADARDGVGSAWSARPRARPALARLGCWLQTAARALAHSVVWPLQQCRSLARGAGLAVRRMGGIGPRLVAMLRTPLLTLRWLGRHRLVGASALALLTALALSSHLKDDAVAFWTDLVERGDQPTQADVSSPGISVPRVKMPEVSLPDISLPRVTIRKPSIDTDALPEFPEVPRFIAGSVTRVGELLAGPVVEKGTRVLVADLETGGDVTPELGHVLALVLEADLSKARRFSVLSRERVVANLSHERAGLRLPLKRSIAAAAASNASAIVGGRLHTSEAGGGYELTLLVLDGFGTEVYRLTRQTTEAELLGSLAEATRGLKRRMGEPAKDALDEIIPPEAALSSSPSALRAYAEARAHLFGRRYRAAASAASAAAEEDTTFAAAHYLLAEAEALRGRRAAAGRGLELAYRFRDRLSERERLRVIADREVFAGRVTQAIFAYEWLFQRYRDDVAALKSLAILQRMIGARGNGEGNLQMAYRLEPVDWPPLPRLARYLGYRGRLPRVSSDG